MSGVIGLTAAGQLLDKHLSTNTFTYTSRIYKFVVKFTKKVHRIRKSLSAYVITSDKEYILTLIRKEYIDILDTDLSTVIDSYSYTLIKNYIHALTHLYFTPSTRTQISFMNKHGGMKHAIITIA